MPFSRQINPPRKIRPFPVAILLLLIWPALAIAHGGHAPGLLGNPSQPPSGATVIRDGAGRLLYVEYDADGDGRVDVWNRYEQGQLVRQEVDQNQDEVADLRFFVENGQVVRTEIDPDFDGAFDLAEEYQDGQLQHQVQDTNGDGSFDTHHYIENGLHSRTELDTDSDGRIDRWIFYDQDENPTLIMADTDGDGAPDRQNRMAESPSSAEQTPTSEENEEQAEEPAPSATELAEVTVTARRPLTAASDQEVRYADFIHLPRQNPSDLVRVIPGVHVSQHTGGAKAYQYFLRGFDAEHGQDMAAYLDGIPLNEPSQVHGHGYLDLHFLIPETICSIKVVKGPYDPEYGNFATAGAINFLPRRVADNNTVSATAGMYGTVRTLGTFGWQADPYLLVGAIETDHTEGYTDPGDADAFRANTGHTFLFDSWTVNLISNHYGQDSAATDVIPEQWVEEGLIGRYEAIDSSDRVISNRHLVGATADWESGVHQLRLQGFFDYKRTVIWSNYTFYLLNPDRGDQQEMLDNRSVYGANVRYVHNAAWGSTNWETAAGVQWRLDEVDQVLANSAERKRWNVINHLDFTENAIGLWARENVAFTKWLSFVPGVRFDLIQYAGDGTQDERYFNIYTNLPDTRQDVERDWNESASIFTPKASLIFTPLPDWNLFLNYGEGFFSNTTLQMANEPESSIPRVRGGEIGTRLFFWDRRITTAASAWYADKEKDLVFDPQTGLSVQKEKTRRQGLDGEFRLQPIPWLFVMTDASYVDARFIASGDRIPNGPIFLMTNGLGWNHSLGLSGMIRGRYMGERELDQGDFAPPYYIVDLVGGYITPQWAVELAIDNLFDTEWEDAVFSYQTRPERNGETINGIHWTPGTPFSARLTVTAYF